MNEIKRFACQETKFYYEYEEGTYFHVFVRRSNGRKRALYVGKSISKAYEIYRETRVYQLDVKYLYSETVTLKKDLVLVIREVGKMVREQSRAGKLKIATNYTHVSMGPLRGIPQELYKEVKAFCESAYITNSTLVQLVLAGFMAFDKEDREKYIKHTSKLLNQFIFLSGGDTPKIQQDLKELEEENKKDEDLL
jgi:hypothetical protein